MKERELFRVLHPKPCALYQLSPIHNPTLIVLP
ncbi:MAG: hypothetical protein HW388_842 [Dehalococcoidia bacterium]|nr:hypothetical protein [Dehalococcoidia bacterium]